MPNVALSDRSLEWLAMRVRAALLLNSEVSACLDEILKRLEEAKPKCRS